MRPGSRVMPRPSTTMASSPAAGGSASPAATASIVRPRIVTVAVSSTSSPVKTTAPRMTVAASWPNADSGAHTSSSAAANVNAGGRWIRYCLCIMTSVAMETIVEQADACPPVRFVRNRK